MEQTVLFHAAQEVPSQEMNNLQSYAQGAIDAIVTELLIRSVYYKGLTVTKNSSTEIRIAAGRVYAAGKVYRHAAASTVNMTSYLPAGSNRKILAIVASGSTIDTQAEPRKFLTDPNTRQIRPKTVATRRSRIVEIAVVEGNESLAPIAPLVDVGYALLAYVELSASGVVGDPEAVPDQRAPNLEDVVSSLAVTNSRLAKAFGLIDTLRSDVAGLARQMKGKADIDEITRHDKQIRDIREVIGLPDTATLWGRDSFSNEDESDTAHANYQAEVEGGCLRLPAPTLVKKPVALLNPTEPKLKTHPGGLVLPTYTEIVRYELAVKEAEVALANYSSVTIQRTLKYHGHKFKWWKTKHGGLEKTLKNTGGEIVVLDPETDEKVRLDLDKYKWSKAGDFGPGVWIYIEDYDPYWDVKKSVTNVTGQTIAQTFLNAQSGWITGISIWIKEKAATGDIRLTLCECKANGQPDPDKSLEEVVITNANLTANWNKFTFADPAHVSRGVRYAFVVQSAGAHKLWSSNTNDLSNGTMFHLTDTGAWDGQAQKDLCFRLHAAQFNATRVEVMLDPVTVSGGISEMDFTFTGVRPASTDFDIQARVGGVWRDIDGKNTNLFASEPTTVELRAIWQNTRDDAVGVVLTKSRIYAYKPDNSGVHISTVRTLPGGDVAATVKVELWSRDRDAAHHTVAVKLLHGVDYASVKTAAATTWRTRADGMRVCTATFSFGVGTEPAAYKIRTEFSTDSAAEPITFTERYDHAVPA